MVSEHEKFFIFTLPSSTFKMPRSDRVVLENW